MRAVEAMSPGDPSVLRVVDAPIPRPGADQLLVRVAAAGVNFIDTYRRSGAYPMDFPHIVGSEGAGVVVEAGTPNGEFSPGDRVAWSDAAGSYAEYVLVNADRTLPVPGDVDLDTAAALPLQGMTAHYLAVSTYPVQVGDTVLVHAGAGGVGLLLTQLAVSRGARVVTTVSSDDKQARSLGAGAVTAIRYDQLDDLSRDLPPLVREVAQDGVEAVFDGVGKSTFDASLASLKRRGTLVLFGGASGQVPPFDLQRLNAAGSLFVTRPKLADYTATKQELRWRASEVFAAVADGTLHVEIGARFNLADAAAAHRALEGRATTGRVILEVS